MKPFFQVSGLPLGAQLNAILNPQEAEALARLLKAAPPPIDYRGFQQVIAAASNSLLAAGRCLKLPNNQFRSISDNLLSLHQKVQAVISTGELSPTQFGLARTFAAYPQWRLLFKAGETDKVGILALIGVELSLSLAQGKPMAAAWSKSIHKSTHALPTTTDDMIAEIRCFDKTANAHWKPRTKKAYFAFLSTFESGEYEQQPPRSFTERAVSQWTARAAYATHTVRAGVQDLRSLSSSEFEEVIEHSKLSIELATAVFAVAFTGFTTDLAAEIPIVQCCDDFVCSIDIEAGQLVRDFTCIAYDAALPKGVDGIPASYVTRLQLPDDIANFLQERKKECSDALVLGDLVPFLRQVEGDDLIFPSTAKVAPSWAKLRHTLGRWLRENGFDNLIAAVQSSDFSHIGKSKLYYATIPNTEWIASVDRAYRLLSFRLPFDKQTSQVAFGSRVTPTAVQIQKADKLLQDAVEALRPGRHSTKLSLTKFHDAYAKLVGFRVVTLLALRESSAIPLLDTRAPFAYPAEKSSANRTGNLAVIVPTLLAEQIELLRLHCKSFYQRLDTKSRSTDFGQWLSTAGFGQANHLCYCSLRWRAAPVSSSLILQDTKSGAHLVADFGRKYLENHLRQAGVLTHDIDHCLRHEVKGQEFSSAVAEEVPTTWLRKIKPILDDTAKNLFSAPVPGLRKS